MKEGQLDFDNSIPGHFLCIHAKTSRNADVEHIFRIKDVKSFRVYRNLEKYEKENMDVKSDKPFVFVMTIRNNTFCIPADSEIEMQALREQLISFLTP